MEGFDKLSDDIDKLESLLAADKAYDAEFRVLEILKEKNIESVIPPKRTIHRPENMISICINARHLIENFFAKLK